MPVLCLNSHVVYGYVGNDAAGFCLRRLGVEAWQLDTVVLSNHPGYGACTGRVVPAAELWALLDGIAARNVLVDCEAVLAGYLGAAEQAEVVAHAFAQVRAANPGVLAVCDPVMGDTGPGLYVGSDVAEAIAAEVVPAADVVTPNAFELGWLTGRTIADEADALAAARALLARGPRLVVVTSIPLDGDRLGVLAVSAEAARAIRVPRLVFEVPPNGAGDALAGLLTAHLTRGADAAAALEAAASAVHGVLEATLAQNRRELALPAAQALLVEPPRRFRAVSLS